MTKSIEIKNDGSTLVGSNFWELSNAPQFIVNINAGCFRVLLRDKADPCIAEMKTAKRAVLTRGRMPIIQQDDAIEICFDDGSQQPFTLFTTLNAFNFLPSDDDSGRSDLVLAVYVEPCRKLLELPATWIDERIETQRD